MKIVKRELIKALEVVKPGLASKEIIEQSTSFAFLGDRVVTYNDTISISHPIKDLDLRGAIRAEELYSLINKIKTKTVDLEVTANELKLASKAVKAGIRLHSEIVLPIDEIDEASDWEDLHGDFIEDLQFIKGSAGSDMSRRVLTCVNIQDFYLQASDGFQIMRVNMDIEEPFPFPDILIPAEVIGEIAKIEPIQIAKSSGWIHFKNADGTQISCRILMDDYPDPSAHFKIKGAKLKFPRQMDEIIDRVMVFTKKDHIMDEEMKITVKENKLMVEGKNESGWIKERAKIDYDKAPKSFWITPYLLKAILNRSNVCILGDEKIKFEGDGWEYIAVLRS